MRITHVVWDWNGTLLDDLEAVAALQGIAHVPARDTCAVLAWHTLEEALDGEGKTDKVTTEEEA